MARVREAGSDDGTAVHDRQEERMHGNKLKQILCDQQTGKIIERVVDIA